MAVIAVIIWEADGRCCRPLTHCSKIQISCVSFPFFQKYYRDMYILLRSIYLFRLNGNGLVGKLVLMEALLEMATVAMDDATGLDASVEVHVGSAEEK